MKSGKIKKYIKVCLAIIASIGVLCASAVLCVNAYVKNTAGDRIISQEEAQALSDIDCVIVLGCKVKENGVPSHMLEDRLRRSVELYQLEAAPKLLMSGDHGRTEYDEVNAMKKYAINAGVPSSDVFMDHAGFSTYESIYRAKEIFGVQKVIIVTQGYHLYRALYIAEELGVEAYGVNADYRRYSGQGGREIRELLARNKDALTAIFKPLPTYLGEYIPIDGNGDVTND